MKRGVLIFLLIILSFSLIVAEEESITETSSPVSEQQKVDEAYQCVNDKVDGKCSTLSLEQQIFAYLATGKCRAEILANSENENCWPKDNCNVVMTAKAMLALGSDKPKAWINSKKAAPDQIEWFLQIESPQQTTCKISYDSNDYNVNVGSDKRVGSGAGPCLTISDTGYWLRISPNCYGKDLKVSCDQNFLTNLWYRKSGSQTVHVSSETHQSSASGSTTEKVVSSCLKTGTTCDYEGTLWAALALNSIKEDYDEYLPYLSAESTANRQFLPDSFLYALTGSAEFRNSLVTRQKSNQYWDEGNRFYDTAVAMLGIRYDSSQEKTSTINWLLEVQGDNGCWNDNVRDTSFLIYSVWGRGTTTSGPASQSCQSEGFYCTPSISCPAGKIEEGLSCAGTNVCCSEPPALASCASQGGTICRSAETCTGNTVSSSDSGVCCVGGTCREADPTPNLPFCSTAGGFCEFTCDDKSIRSDDYQCSQTSQVCCLPKKSNSYWWIWLLAILIILAILGIIFKDKLMIYVERFKSKGKTSAMPPRPGMPSSPRPSNIPNFARPQMPAGAPQFRKPLPSQRPKEDIDDVLKKLKDMGS